MNCNLAVVGGGPVGLFLAIRLANEGHEVSVFEKKQWPIDKVCGQGIMPSGYQLLQEIGIQFKDDEGFEFSAIQYFDQNIKATGRLSGTGIGVERKVLSQKLYEMAKSHPKIQLLSQTSVEDIVIRRDKFALQIQHQNQIQNKSEISSQNGIQEFDYIFACDGLNSQIRKKVDLEKVRRSPLRSGARIHFDVQPEGPCVQTYWSRSIEAYVTPVAADKTEVAFLWFNDAIEKRPQLLERLFASFPELRKRFSLEHSNEDFKGYGPFKTTSRRMKKKNLFLVGDAYQFLDGITGEGVSLGLKSADILSKNFLAFGVLARFKIALIYWNYSFWVNFALVLSRRVPLRRFFLKRLQKNRWLFNMVLKLNDLGCLMKTNIHSKKISSSSFFSSLKNER